MKTNHNLRLSAMGAAALCLAGVSLGAPTGYVPLEYIESTGTQWIDTKTVAQGANTSVEMDVTATTTTSEMAFFGYAWGKNQYLLILRSGNILFYGPGTSVAPYVANHDYRFSVTNGTVTVIDETTSTTNSKALTDTYAGSASLPIFAHSGGGRKASFRLRRMKIWRNDVLVRDFIPCYRSDAGGVRTPGLYDEAGDYADPADGFFANKGTGNFLMGDLRGGRLQVSGAPMQCGSPEPGYGYTFNLTAGATLPVSCPAVWTNEADTVAATCTGWKLYDDAGNVISQGPETSFNYIHPGATRRLEWQWAVEYRIDASTTGGGTVAPVSQWAVSGATATVTATPSATHTFHHWTGDLSAGASAQAATISLTVTAPAAIQAVFSKVASSGTRTWIGGDSGDWNTAANWDPEGVPAVNETVVFAASAAVAPPASFAGTISVAAGATVAATYAAPATFSIAVAAGGRFEKHGAAEATISPADGDYPGTVAVCEGSVAFAGNGPENAPGLFGPLEVAAGATARVVASPFDMRHAVVTYAKFDARAEATKTAEFNTYAKLQAKWAEYAAGGAFRRAWVPSGTANAYALNNTSYLPAEMYANTNKNYALITKGIFLFPTSKARRWQVRDAYGSGWYYRATSGLATAYDTAHYVTTRAGWVPFAAGFGTDNKVGAPSSNYLVLFRLDANTPATLANVFSHGTIWNGVCFGGLSLPTGATLRVEDGQAVGFAFTSQPEMEGSVVAGGPGACFSLMLSHDPLDLAKLAGFAGKVEVGVHGRAGLSAACAEASFSTMGDGEFVAEADGLEPLLPAGFTGTVRVPAGRTFSSTAALGAGVVFVGDGTVTVAPGAPRPAADFAGRVVLSGAQTAEATAIGLATHAGLEFGAGSTLTFGGSGAALAQGVRRDLPAFADGWTLAGTAAHGANGSVSLTDGASQTAAVWLPSYASLQADVWRVSFTYSASATASGAVLGDGFAFLLRTGWGEIPVVRGVRYSGKDRDWICNTSANDSTCFGFTFRPIAGGAGGFSWVAQGYPGNGPGSTLASLSDFDPLQPIDFTVSYAGNALIVRMEQGTASAEFRRVFTQLYTSGNKKPRFLGIAASTGTAAQGTLVQGLSNLSGWYRTEAYAGNCEAAPAFDISASNWVLFKNAAFTNDATAIQLCSEPVTAGVAIARAPLSLRRKFRLACRVVTEELDDSYVRSFFAAMLQNQGLAAGELPPSGGKESGAVQEVYALPTIANSVAGYFQSYTAQSQSGLGYRTAARTFTGQTTASMPTGSTQTFGYTLAHDGYGRLTESLAYGGIAYNTSASFSQLAPSAIGDEFHLMLSGYCGYYNDKGVYHHAKRMRVDNLSVVFPLNHDAVFDTPVAFDGDATLVVGNIETNAATATVSFSSVTIGAGATLTVAAEDPEAGVRAGMGVALGGPAGLTAAEGAVVRLDTVTVSAASPATLTLVGDFTLGPDGLTVVIAGGRQLRAGFKLLDIADATFAGGIDASRIHFVDEEGHPLDSFVAVVRGDDVRVQFRGGTMLLLR